MARRKPRPEATPPTDLNLVPIMNLVVCLIPIVLLGTALVKVGVIDITPPRIVPSANPNPIETEQLGLSIGIDDAGFTLTAAGADVGALVKGEHPPGTPIAIPRVGETLDFVSLYGTLVQLKKVYPDDTQMTLSAEAGTPWREVISTLDVARMRLAEDTYDAPSELARATEKTGPMADRLLYPDVVFLAAR